tara:strand:- start:139 stop:516 length:378 start_codon:yes stop_codon:yes gene_type:complete
MKPTQEQILRALNKLVRENKTELKAEKIELGLAQDLEKGITKAKADISYLKKLDKQKLEAYKTIEKVFDIASNMNDGNFYAKIGNEANKAIKQAKELGVDLPEAKQMKDLTSDFFKWFTKARSKK